MQVFILGVNDPEMQEIEKILQEQGESYQYAMSGGRRVHPGNAYKADEPSYVGNEHEIVFVECGMEGGLEEENEALPRQFGIHHIDHHRPGDHGYGLPASDFWQASSLGQLCKMLDVVPSQDQLVLAAMDHCPAAAIRGECPGVSAQEVLERKIQEIAKATNHSAGDVRRKISLYSDLIEKSPFLSISMDGGMLVDMREYYLGEGYSVELLAAQTAALAGGHTVLLKHRDAPGKPEKWLISGHASPDVIEAFIKHWAPSKGLVGIYGVPNRGYAGGYLPE